MVALVAGNGGGGIQHLDLLMHLLHVVQEALGGVKLGVGAGGAGPVAGPLGLGPSHDHQALHHVPGHFRAMLALHHCIASAQSCYKELKIHTSTAPWDLAILRTSTNAGRVSAEVLRNPKVHQASAWSPGHL